jgi:hypothetical protein
MTTIRCTKCTRAMVFCAVCGRWVHKADGSYRCGGQDAHLCATEPDPAALHAVTGPQARRWGT